MSGENDDLVFKILNHNALGDILKIENDVHINPWSENTFRDCFTNEHYLISGLYFKKRLVGYCVLLLISPQAELHNFAIDKQFQSRGNGGLFLKYILGLCESLKLEQIFLEVRESNSVAISFYQKSGFSQIGIRKDYYQSESLTESALLFMLDLG